MSWYKRQKSVSGTSAGYSGQQSQPHLTGAQKNQTQTFNQDGSSSHQQLEFKPESRSNKRNASNPREADQGGHPSHSIDTPLFERRKDRASSSSKAKQQSQGDQLPDPNQSSSLTRNMQRPSSKHRLASQQQANSNSQTKLQYPSTQSKMQKSTQQARGSSPKVPSTIKNNQLNMTGSNLQNYFDNQIPQINTASSKNLPRKKRNLNQQPLQTSQSNQNSGQGYQKQQVGSLPPMHGNPTGTNSANTGTEGGGVKHPSPARQQSQQPDGQGFNQGRSSNQARPSNPSIMPQQFEQEELFLNVDPAYNNLLMQMIQPNRDQFDFEGQIQYVINASELSNQALHKMLYNHRKHVTPPPCPRLQQQTTIRPPTGTQRSRNVTDPSMLGGNAAGQSTLSYFNTKRGFTSNSLTKGSSTEGSSDSQTVNKFGDFDPSQCMGDFFSGLRQELKQTTDDNVKQLMPDYQPAKFSAKRNGIVAAYGANTNQGIVRNYNEDRVAIILNIMKPKQKQFTGVEWPKCSFFGIYDGHGGHQCADYLRDYLHQFIIKDKFFPSEPIKAIKNGFSEAEKLFLEYAENQGVEVGDIDRSGSCAIVALIIDDMCYIGNTGDSRACMSAEGGKKVYGLSVDHKPTDDVETHRILSNNGRIYQNASIVNAQAGAGITSQIVLGPHRVFPGRLSVCRTFGDIEAKVTKFGGNNAVVVADPDVTCFKIDRQKHDFIVIGCDGIFDKLENRDCVHLPWLSTLSDDMCKEATPFSNTADEEIIGQKKSTISQDERRHKLAGLAVDSILKSSAIRKSCDNITAVVIAFDNFYKQLDKKKTKETGFNHEFDPEVIEEIQMNPTVGDSFLQSEIDKHKPIYIQNDAAFDTHEDTMPSQDVALRLNSESNTSLQSSTVFGDTGDHSFPKQQTNLVQSATVNVAEAMPDKLLSEIAEEDSVSMISDRPRKFRKSDIAMTPNDNNSEMPYSDSLRVSKNKQNFSAARREERVIDQEKSIKQHTQAPVEQSKPQQTQVPPRPPSRQKQQNAPEIDQSKIKLGSSEINPDQLKQVKIIGNQTTLKSQKTLDNRVTQPLIQPSIVSQYTQVQKAPQAPQMQSNIQKPPSRSNSQNNERPLSSGTKSMKARIQQKNIIEIAKSSKQLQSKQQASNQPSFDFLASGAYANQAFLNKKITTQNTSSLPQFSGLQNLQSQSQSAIGMQNTSSISTGQLGEGHDPSNDNDQSQSQIMFKVKKRRSSNQNHQRPSYNTGNQNNQSHSNPPQNSHSSHTLTNSGVSQLQMLNQKIQNSGRANSHKAHAQDKIGGKAKTQQPGKLTEILRQVEPNNQNATMMLANSKNNQSLLQGLASQAQVNNSHFIQKGNSSQHSNGVIKRSNQVMNQSALNTHGAKVHNIQIKPISANKRRSGTTGLNQSQNQTQQIYNQTQTLNSNQGNVQISNLISNQRSSSQKDKHGFSQTSIIASQGILADQHKTNKTQMVSTYLAQVNNGQKQQNQPSGQGNSYATRTNRNVTDMDAKGQGMVSRTNRVQMSYNVGSSGIQSSQTLPNQIGPKGNSSLGAAALSNNPAKNQNIYNQLISNTQGSQSQFMGKVDHKSRNSGKNTTVAASHSMPKWQPMNNQFGQIGSTSDQSLAQSNKHGSSQNKKFTRK